MLDQTSYQKRFNVIVNCIRDENDLMSEAIASAFQVGEKDKHQVALVSMSLFLFLISQALWVLFIGSEYSIKDEVGRRNAEIAEMRRREEEEKRER